MKLNNKNLNKIIKWTSSKYNEYKKDEITLRVLDYAINGRQDTYLEFSCGSYSEHSNCGGYHYKVTKDNNKLKIERNNDKFILDI